MNQCTSTPGEILIITITVCRYLAGEEDNEDDDEGSDDDNDDGDDDDGNEDDIYESDDKCPLSANDKLQNTKEILAEKLRLLSTIPINRDPTYESCHLKPNSTPTCTVKSISAVEELYKCPRCSKLYKTKGGRDRHISLKHSDLNESSK